MASNRVTHKAIGIGMHLFDAANIVATEWGDLCTGKRDYKCPASHKWKDVTCPNCLKLKKGKSK